MKITTNVIIVELWPLKDELQLKLDIDFESLELELDIKLVFELISRNESLNFRS